MSKNKDISDEVSRKIEIFKNQLKDGEIDIFDIKLLPIFDDLKDSLNISNIDFQSKTYKEACDLLDEKFDELIKRINNIDEYKKFETYLNSNHKESEILQLLDGCWIQPFGFNSLSLNFLESSKNKLLLDPKEHYEIKHLQRQIIDDEFLLEIPQHKFSEQMNEFFEKIKSKLPCFFDDIFEGIEDQVELYQYFVYILHLLQTKKLKYQKETNTLYI